MADWRDAQEEEWVPASVVTSGTIKRMKKKAGEAPVEDIKNSFEEKRRTEEALQKTNQRCLLVADNIAQADILMEAALSNVTVLQYDWEKTKLEEIPMALAACEVPFVSVGIACHGKSGVIELTKGIEMSRGNLYDDRVQAFWVKLCERVQNRVDLLSSKTAADENGKEFVRLLKAMTGTKVTASTDHTGIAGIGTDAQNEEGDFFLETDGIDVSNIYFNVDKAKAMNTAK